MSNNNIQIIGRQDEIDMISLTLATKQHGLMVGEPGIAKSLVIERVVDKVSKDKTLFKALLHPTLPVEALVGPLDVREYTDSGSFTYKTDGFLPSASFAFIDEVFRGERHVRDALLSVMNERKFRNGNETIDCPLQTLFGATNSYPGYNQDPDSEAFIDRWLFRTEVKPLTGREKEQYMASSCHRFLKVDPEIETILNKAKKPRINTLSCPVKEVYLSFEMFKLLREVTEVVREIGVWISDRREGHLALILGASASLDGRNEITNRDFWNLRFSLWRDISHIAEARKFLKSISFPNRQKIDELRDELFRDINSEEKKQLLQAKSYETSELARVMTLAKAINVRIVNAIAEIQSIEGWTQDDIEDLEQRSGEVRRIMAGEVSYGN